MSIIFDILGYLFIDLIIYILCWIIVILLWFIIIPVVVIVVSPFIAIISFKGDNYAKEFKKLYMKVVDKWIGWGLDLVGNKYRKIRY